MKKRIRTTLLHEEKRTVKWFLWLFYSIYIIYDITYFYILPENPWDRGSGLPSGGMGYLIYIVMIGLLPIAYYLMKKDNPWLIKYVYFFAFTFANIVNDIMVYWGNNEPYSNGNVVEIVIVLFSPIFVNKKFFYIVSLGTMAKFLIVGLILLDSIVLFPLLIVVVLAMIAYILLNRFLGYVNSLRDSYDKQLEGIVKGIIAILELKDPYTRGHSVRVAEYSQILAKATGKFKKDELISFYYACLLHDIGKVNIPDSILTKPGRLTEEEFKIIKTHPIVGAEAVQKVEGIDDHIEVIYYHHERWDGRGYPEGLKGENIPLLARITTIADAFDAMTSSRSYRSALPLEEAYRRIIEGKGTQFDPDLVDLFSKVYLNWVETHKKYYKDVKGIKENLILNQRG